MNELHGHQIWDWEVPIQTSDRPERSSIINDDDILNLKIALELMDDLEDILKDEHIFEQ